MTNSPYFRQALERFRATRAELLGCAPSDFDKHSLVVVDRPESQPAKFLMMALTFGTGTVVAVRPDYSEWVHANAPTDKHYRAMFPNVLLQPLVEEAARRRETAGWRSPNLAFLPANEPVALSIPAGLRAMPFDPAWRDEQRPKGEFHNALGELDASEDGGFLYGLAIMDGDSPAAVAGGWDDEDGIVEIGVDVARAYRGRGLAEVVVTNLSRLIAERGAVPSYYCAPTNVRSHRNAIGSGFLPVASACRATITSTPPAN